MAKRKRRTLRRYIQYILLCIGFGCMVICCGINDYPIPYNEWLSIKDTLILLGLLLGAAIACFWLVYKYGDIFRD